MPSRDPWLRLRYLSQPSISKRRLSYVGQVGASNRPAAVLGTNYFKQAAPAIDPTRRLSLGREIKLFEPNAGQNIALGNSREPLV
jgi:hypothetical protein